MSSKIIYSLKWIKQYFLNRAIYVFLTIFISIVALGFFNVGVSGDIKIPLKTLNCLNETTFLCTGITNHSNYSGDNFYQQIDAGYFYAKQTEDELTDRVSALALKKVKGKAYSKDVSPIENCGLIKGRLPQSAGELVVSKNVAESHDLKVGSALYYVDTTYCAEYTICGILEEFYGAYDIEINAENGLLLFYEDTVVNTSIFVHFFETMDDATYAKTYRKVDDMRTLNAHIRNSIKQNCSLSILTVVFIFLLLNLNIKKYVVRLRVEYCGRRGIFAFFIGLIVSVLLIIFIIIAAVLLLLKALTCAVAVVIGIEFAVALLALTVIYTLVFLWGKRI